MRVGSSGTELLPRRGEADRAAPSRSGSTSSLDWGPQSYLCLLLPAPNLGTSALALGVMVGLGLLTCSQGLLSAVSEFLSHFSHRASPRPHPLQRSPLLHQPVWLPQGSLPWLPRPDGRLPTLLVSLAPFAWSSYRRSLLCVDC